MCKLSIELYEFLKNIKSCEVEDGFYIKFIEQPNKLNCSLQDNTLLVYHIGNTNNISNTNNIKNINCDLVDNRRIVNFIINKFAKYYKRYIREHPIDLIVNINTLKLHYNIMFKCTKQFYLWYTSVFNTYKKYDLKLHVDKFVSIVIPFNNEINYINQFINDIDRYKSAFIQFMKQSAVQKETQKNSSDKFIKLNSSQIKQFMQDHTLIFSTKKKYAIHASTSLDENTKILCLLKSDEIDVYDVNIKELEKGIIYKKNEEIAFIYNFIKQSYKV